MATVNKETGEIIEDVEAEADAAENEHERPEGWIKPTVTDESESAPETAAADAKRGSDASAAPLTAKQLEALGKKIDGAATAHENALRRILGDDFAEWLPCPLCMTDGHLAPMPAEDRDPAQVDAVLAALGMGGPAMLRPDDRYEVCSGCDGFGQRRTPSKRAENQVVNCDDCASRGYREKPVTPVASVPTWTPPPPTFDYGPAAVTGTGVPDPWGRPEGHRDYGIPPAQVGAA